MEYIVFFVIGLSYRPSNYLGNLQQCLVYQMPLALSVPIGVFLGRLSPCLYNALLVGFAVKTIAVFVDVQNIYYTTREAYGRKFDYRKLWQRISAEGEIVSATAYAIHRDDDKQLKFQNALNKIGFTVKLKPYIQRSDGSAKGDWDVGITIDIMEAAKNVDTIVLLSGDGDFDLLLKKIKKDFAVSVEVYGVPALTAASLIDSASAYYRIGEDLLL